MRRVANAVVGSATVVLLLAIWLTPAQVTGLTMLLYGGLWGGRWLVLRL